MKKWMCALLACCLACSFAACGGDKAESPGSGDSGSAVQSSAAPAEPPAESESQEEDQPEELSLDQGEVRLAYANGNVLAVVFHGPYRDIGMSFCDKEGNQLDDLFLGYGDLNPGWTMAVTYDMSDAYSIDELALRVSDYDAPRNPDNTYANQLFTSFGEPMSDDELAAVGFDFLDGRCCIVSKGKGTYGDDNFGFTFGVSWFCDNYDREAYQIDIPNFPEKFTFFTGDGTPLAEAYEGYSLQTELNHGTFWVQLFAEEDNEAKHKELADQLIEGKPYMVYTGDDGSTQTFPLR